MTGGVHQKHSENNKTRRCQLTTAPETACTRLEYEKSFDKAPAWTIFVTPFFSSSSTLGATADEHNLIETGTGYPHMFMVGQVTLFLTF